jgi:DNA repair protein RadC
MKNTLHEANQIWANNPKTVLAHLTDAQLLALVIGDKPAAELMDRYECINGDLKCAIERHDTTNIPHSTLKKLLAAQALSARLAATTKRKERMQNSLDMATILQPYFIGQFNEQFYCVMLNKRHNVIAVDHISSGGIAGTVCDPKNVFTLALQRKASAIVLAHNHPSGNTTPSQADIEITKKIKAAGDYLDIRVLDHIIYCGEQYGSIVYTSFADNGEIV